MPVARESCPRATKACDLFMISLPKPDRGSYVLERASKRYRLEQAEKLAKAAAKRRREVA